MSVDPASSAYTPTPSFPFDSRANPSSVRQLGSIASSVARELGNSVATPPARWPSGLSWDSRALRQASRRWWDLSRVAGNSSPPQPVESSADIASRMTGEYGLSSLGLGAVRPWFLVLGPAAARPRTRGARSEE